MQGCAPDARGVLSGQTNRPALDPSQEAMPGLGAWPGVDLTPGLTDQRRHRTDAPPMRQRDAGWAGLPDPADQGWSRIRMPVCPEDVR
jgi:hypothetical protein